VTCRKAGALRRYQAAPPPIHRTSVPGLHAAVGCCRGRDLRRLPTLESGAACGRGAPARFPHTSEVGWRRSRSSPPPAVACPGSGRVLSDRALRAEPSSASHARSWAALLVVLPAAPASGRTGTARPRNSRACERAPGGATAARAYEPNVRSEPGAPAAAACPPGSRARARGTRGTPLVLFAAACVRRVGSVMLAFRRA